MRLKISAFNEAPDRSNVTTPDKTFKTSLTSEEDNPML